MEHFHNGQAKRPDLFQWTRNWAGDGAPDGWIELYASEAKAIPHNKIPL
jgi:hypothetical protein